jgi:phage terminase small subunit
MASKSSKPINPQHRRFAEEYVIDFNATHAAIRAGYSKRSAHTTGYRLLKDAEVQKMLTELIEKQAAKAGVSAERVLKEISSVAFKKISPQKTGEMRNKLRALELLGKNLGLFIEKHELSGENGGPLTLVVRGVGDAR